MNGLFGCVLYRLSAWSTIMPPIRSSAGTVGLTGIIQVVRCRFILMFKGNMQNKERDKN